METPVTKEAIAKDPVERRQYTVEDIVGPQSVTAGKEITLTCVMTGIFAKETKTRWRMCTADGTAVLEEGQYKEQGEKYKVEKTMPIGIGDRFSNQLKSTLTFKPTGKHDGAEFVCEFILEVVGRSIKSQPAKLKVVGGLFSHIPSGVSNPRRAISAWKQTFIRSADPNEKDFQPKGDSKTPGKEQSGNAPVTADQGGTTPGEGQGGNSVKENQHVADLKEDQGDSIAGKDKQCTLLPGTGQQSQNPAKGQGQQAGGEVKQTT
ncbi:uncharacterized protein LOC106705979 [Latimeria chalumnae]|uniref:uncharacterized protein LOC106705979 n=1 Tax=Latimeria chalumnae TaxID=7897 RepID=UPI0006D93058|nr:PREDICTED: uncharacterized protein LOC106705979 [Latimeria chalumnae]|eukprot:XP_014351706.1 PREDICTED: uncharacterized protein LOC106705979 [Latimeria chalumnae]